MRTRCTWVLGLGALVALDCSKRPTGDGTGGTSGAGATPSRGGAGGRAGQGGRAGGGGSAGNTGGATGGIGGIGGAGSGGTSGGGGQAGECAALGLQPTSISGIVYAPSGSLPLSGITVYVPRVDPGPLPTGVAVDRCSDPLPGDAVAMVTTNETGAFRLSNAPAGSNVKVVITSGKWRKQISIANVMQCRDNPLPAIETTLPRNRLEGDMPQIAITTGSADALECLVRRIGIADSEITTDAQGGRVHLYADLVTGGLGSDRFEPGFAGGSGPFGDAPSLWSNPSRLQGYDMMLMSCEGDQHPESKPQAAMDAVKAYADSGGRLLLSHFHNVWIAGSIQGDGGTQMPAIWPALAGWSFALISNVPVSNVIDETSNPKGAVFAGWMLHVGASTTRGQFSIDQVKRTCASVDVSRVERWAYNQDGAEQLPQIFQFTTPNESPRAQRRGKVMFADIHVDASAAPYPGGCASGALSTREKVLAYIFFDLSSCVNAGP